jgi:hypothetical protein
MAHTTKGYETIFIHNSDMSGEITIKNDNGELNVSGNNIVNFVLEHLRNEKIGQLEQMNERQLKNATLNALCCWI